MAGGLQGVQGRRVESVSSSAAGGVAPARGPSPADYCGVAKALAERGTPLTPEELAAFHSMRAREMARAEAKREGPSPQGDLLEAA